MVAVLKTSKAKRDATTRKTKKLLPKKIPPQKMFFLLPNQSRLQEQQQKKWRALELARAIAMKEWLQLKEAKNCSPK